MLRSIWKSFQTTMEHQKSIIETPTDENRINCCEISTNVANVDKNSSGDKSRFETANSQNKADYKSAETAV